MKILEKYIPGVSKLKIGDKVIFNKLNKNLHPALSVLQENQLKDCEARVVHYHMNDYISIWIRNEIPYFGQYYPYTSPKINIIKIIIDSKKIDWVERYIKGKCNLPPAQDLIKQLGEGDKVLLKNKEELGEGSTYVNYANPYIEQVGKEVTVQKVLKTHIHLGPYEWEITVVTKPYNTFWWIKEIKKITYISVCN